jgi:ATP-dependent protease ClpP protease subunit
VCAVVEGLVASVGTFLLIAGTKRYITPSLYILIHQLSTL